MWVALLIAVLVIVSIASASATRRAWVMLSGTKPAQGLGELSASWIAEHNSDERVS